MEAVSMRRRERFLSYLDKRHDGQPHLKGEKRKSVTETEVPKAREMRLQREKESMQNDASVAQEKKGRIKDQHKGTLFNV